MRKILLIVGVSLIASVGLYYVSNLIEKPNQISMQSSIQDLSGENNQNNQNQMENQNIELRAEILKEGSGEEAKAGDRVSVHYVGTLENGEKFDSSRDRGTPFDFNLGAGEVIQGWDIGVAGMKIGEVKKLTIPSALGYGSQAVGPIPSNSTLIFEVELLGINR